MGPWLWLSALAQPPEADVAAPAAAIEWRAPATCPSVDEVARRVERRVRHGSAPGAAARLEVQTSASGLSLALTLAIDGGAVLRRTIEASQCDDLVDAAAIVIAVAIDPVFVVRTPEIAVVVDEVVAPEPSPPRPRAVDTRPRMDPPPTRAREPLRIGLRAGAGAWIGAMARPAPTVAIDLVVPAVRLGWAELGAMAVPRQRVRPSDAVRVDLWLVTAVLRGCLSPVLGPSLRGVGRVRPTACAGAVVGAMGGAARGALVASTDARALWVSVALGGGVDVAVANRLRLFARFEGHMHARRPGFHVDGVGPVHRVAPGSVTALVGLQAVLP